MYFSKSIVLLSSMLALAAGPVAVGEKPIARWHLAPFWEGTVMHGESLFFLEEETGAAPTSTLLFTPTRILTAIHPATGVTYEEGRDFTVDRATRRVTLTRDSRIPFTTRADFEPPLGKSGQLYRDETRDIFFGAGPFFHNLQVEFTYEHDGTEWARRNGAVPEPSPLPRLYERLATDEPITVCLLGDSISFGLDASAVVDAPPHQPAYGDLFVQGLTATFGNPVTFTNFSISGMSTPWGIEQAPLVAQKNPDLVIIAFGMNDASGRLAPADFTAHIQRMMEIIRTARPQVSFLLVSPMRGNADWKHAAPEIYPQYRDALMGLRGDDVAVADLTSVWTLMLESKRYADLTGNGVNHPNDFGHRVYAQVLLALIPPRER